MKKRELIYRVIMEAQSLFITDRIGDALDCLCQSACHITGCKNGFFARYDKWDENFSVESSANKQLEINNEEIFSVISADSPHRIVKSSNKIIRSLEPVNALVCGLYAEGEIEGLFVLIDSSSAFDLTQVDELSGLILAGQTFIHHLIYKEIMLRNQNMLVDNEVRYNSLLENAVDAIITINEKGVIQSFNNSAEKMFGYKREEVIGKNVNILMPEPYQTEHDSYIRNYLESGEPKVIGMGRAVHGMRKDGHIFPLDLAIGEMMIKGKRMFTGIARDITDRRRVEQKSRENALRLKAVVENVVDGIITIDSKGVVQSMNSAAEKLFGYRRVDVIGKNIRMLMPEPFQSEHDGYLNNYERTRQAKIIGIGREVTGLRQDGSVFPMELAVGEVKLEGERLFTGVIRDITERKRMEKMKNEFVSTVSHELRTPLTSIRGALGLLNGGILGEISEEAAQMINIASSNTQRLLLLINDILDIQKIESNNMVFKFQAINFHRFMQEALEGCRGLEKEMGVKFNLHPFDEKIMVFADKDRLIQVVNNLLSNAAKFSPEGAVVDVTVELTRSMVRLSVEDCGPGIPMEFRDKLFEKFTQSDSSDTRKLGGTGLGLSICKLIVEKHGGLIGFSDASGGGSIFYFEIPELVTSARSLRGKKLDNAKLVLIIEDDPQIAMILQAMYADMGLQSEIAFSIRQAKKLLSNPDKKYDCISLDIVLPKEDGIQFLHSIKTNSQLNSIPIIVLSVKADEVKEECAEKFQNVAAWLTKPIDVEGLHKAISSALAHSKRILHVEDDRDVHDVVRRLIGNKYSVDWSGDLKSAKEKLATQDYDLVLLDLMLPDGSGGGIVDWLRERNDSTKIIIFSAIDKSEEFSDKSVTSLLKSTTTNKQLLDNIESVINNG